MRFLQEPAMAHTNDQDLLTDLYNNVIYFYIHHQLVLFWVPRNFKVYRWVVSMGSTFVRGQLK